MAAIEDIVAWCQAERTRLAHQLEELQSGRLRTFEKFKEERGWLEIDTTAPSIDLCRHYISELNAIVARYPEVVPVARAEPAIVPPRMVAPVAPAEAGARALEHDAVHPDWAHGWAVVKGSDPKWEFKGIYPTRIAAEDAAAQAGDGYYVRWGSYNERSKELVSGPRFGID